MRHNQSKQKKTMLAIPKESVLDSNTNLHNAGMLNWDTGRRPLRRHNRKRERSRSRRIYLRFRKSLIKRDRNNPTWKGWKDTRLVGEVFLIKTDDFQVPKKAQFFEPKLASKIQKFRGGVPAPIISFPLATTDLKTDLDMRNSNMTVKFCSYLSLHSNKS